MWEEFDPPYEPLSALFIIRVRYVMSRWTYYNQKLLNMKKQLNIIIFNFQWHTFSKKKDNLLG